MPEAEPESARPPRESFFPDSLCHDCVSPRFLRTPRSTFLFCRRLRLYPPQPVRQCDVFEKREEAPVP